MEEKYRWHYNDEEFLKYARESVNNAMLEFDYKTFITPHNETRELIGRIIEEFQYLEACIKHLIQCAVENNIYNAKTVFNFDNYIPASKIINSLKDILIDEKIAKQLLSLMKFRNYIIHSYYLDDNNSKMEKEFPNFLFMIYEAVDYISNVTNRIIGGATHIPNVFEVKPTE